LLLCLLLVAKAGVGAVLSVTGAAGYGQPEPDGCPFVSVAAFEGAHVDPALPTAHEQPTSPGTTEPASPTLHHHHFCAHCVMQAAVTASPPVPVPSDEVAPKSATNLLTSAVLSLPLHPPRARC
jgi:hypothetical protein